MAPPVPPVSLELPASQELPASSKDTVPRAVIFGCEGPRLTAWERAFFADVDPLGFILFERNCEDPAQVKALTGEMRALLGRADAPIFIDQEGGRVQRLKPPQWRAAPPGAIFGALWQRDPASAVAATRINARLLAEELRPLGIDVDCLPLLDLPVAGAHDVIGDRAYGSDPDCVAALAAACCEGLRQGGVLPVLKHIPGHGRCRVDSHASLPVVEAPAENLAAWDLRPFQALKDAPIAMTAHAIYSDIDPELPATLSAKVIGEVMRRQIGFQGLLLSDDLAMKALTGDLKSRAADALAAGCDLVLHCNGLGSEMAAVAAGSSVMTAAACARYDAARAMLPESVAPVSMAALAAELDERLAPRAAAC